MAFSEPRSPFFKWVVSSAQDLSADNRQILLANLFTRTASIVFASICEISVCATAYYLYPKSPLRGVGRRRRRAADCPPRVDLAVLPAQRPQPADPYIGISLSRAFSGARSIRLRHLFVQYQRRSDAFPARQRLRGGRDRRTGRTKRRHAPARAVCRFRSFSGCWRWGRRFLPAPASSCCCFRRRFAPRASLRLHCAAIATPSRCCWRAKTVIGLLMRTVSPACPIARGSASFCWSAPRQVLLRKDQSIRCSTDRSRRLQGDQ